MQKILRRLSALTFAFLLWPALPQMTWGQSVVSYAIEASAIVQNDPPQIVLLWPATDPGASYSVYRKAKEDTAWGPPLSMPLDATSYIDTNVAVGGTYEYHLWRSTTNYDSHAYVLAGIQAPLVESRGKVILVVDNTYSSSLAAELTRLQQDLVGDGWTVVRHDVPRMAADPAANDPATAAVRLREVAGLKALIKSDYLADPTNVKALFLFGHVPVPYSGSLAPDEHLDHKGAWPADVYYGDLDGLWTDSSVTITTPTDPRNINVPGDGKFDQTHRPVNVAVQMGRVDLANLPTLPLSELELLRQYLNKDHAFRQQSFVAQPRAVVDDHFAILGSELPAVDGWASLSSLLGASSVAPGAWLNVVPGNDYLWGYGCGDGTYTGVAGVVQTSHFAVFDVQLVFTMLFGSYFGDWDSKDNLLRAALGDATHTLTAAWAARPYWFFHHMGLGETIGYSTRLTQNNTGLYLPSLLKPNGFSVGSSENPTNYMASVHVALMGDPTLRMHTVGPPTSLAATPNVAGGVDLIWNWAADFVLGYNVYRAPAAAGPYVRINPALVSVNTYTDSDITSDRYYMVRAVKLQTSASGTYYNASQGAFAEAQLAPSFSDDSTWAARDTRTWRFDDATGSAGSSPGWDMIRTDQALNVTATASNQFTVRIVSLSTGTDLGPPAHFDNNTAYTWPILTAAGGINGFDPSKVSLLTSEFVADLGGGALNLAQSSDGKSIDLVFTPNHPPVANPVTYNRALDETLRIDIASLLANSTSDPDGDARALLQIGTSTNGTSIVSDGTSLFFSFANTLSETIPYSILDVRNYRPGDTLRVATGFITIDPFPKALPFNAYHAIEIEWQGEPGVLYQVQSRLETETQWTNQGDPFTGTGQPTSLFERASNVTKFFRVVLVK